MAQIPRQKIIGHVSGLGRNAPTFALLRKLKPFMGQRIGHINGLNKFIEGSQGTVGADNGISCILVEKMAKDLYDSYSKMYTAHLVQMPRMPLTDLRGELRKPMIGNKETDKQFGNIKHIKDPISVASPFQEFLNKSDARHGNLDKTFPNSLTFLQYFPQFANIVDGSQPADVDPRSLSRILAELLDYSNSRNTNSIPNTEQFWENADHILSEGIKEAIVEPEDSGTVKGFLKNRLMRKLGDSGSYTCLMLLLINLAICCCLGILLISVSS